MDDQKKTAENGQHPQHEGAGRPRMTPLQRSGEMLHGWRVSKAPMKTDMKAHLESLIDMEVREDDVLLATFMKSGTHWLWEVTKMLRQGQASYAETKKEAVMLEFADINYINAEPSPRTLNSHLPMCHLPKQIAEKKIKIVHIARNPKDVVTSMFYHFKQRTEITMGDLCEKYIANECMMAHQFDYLRQLQNYRKENPDVPIATFYFEDMKTDPLRVTRDLANFLGLDVTEEVIGQIVEACSFAKLKAADDNKKMSPNRPSGVPGIGKFNIYRKGEIGDWKNNLTVAQNEAMDAFIERESQGLEFQFTYT